jgi:hypothetical protein
LSTSLDGADAFLADGFTEEAASYPLQELTSRTWASVPPAPAPISVSRGDSPAAGPPSIAVLPFANLSADPDQEYFCDGLAEELTDTLARLAGLRSQAIAGNRSAAIDHLTALESFTRAGRSAWAWRLPIQAALGDSEAVMRCLEEASLISSLDEMPAQKAGRGVSAAPA